MRHEPSSDVLVVLCSCPDQATATGIATALLASELAACVNCVPGIRSMYRRDGQIREDQEIRARHTYQVPEVLALPAVRGADTYLDWVRQATAG